MHAYDRIAQNLAEADGRSRAIILTFARGSEAMIALALFCAAEGYTREAAARAIGCDTADLDTAIDAFADAITAERQRRQAERAA